MQDCCFSFKKKKTAINAGPVISPPFSGKEVNEPPLPFPSVLFTDNDRLY